MTQIAIKESHMVRLTREAKENGMAYLAEPETSIAQCIRNAENLDRAAELLVGYVCNIKEAFSNAAAKLEKQEPVAIVMHKGIRSNGATTTGNELCIVPYKSVNELGYGTKLFTALPKCEWVKLTDDEVKESFNSIDFTKMVTADDLFYLIARDIEAKLKAKNYEIF